MPALKREAFSSHFRKPQPGRVREPLLDGCDIVGQFVEVDADEQSPARVDSPSAIGLIRRSRRSPPGRSS
jgi:hypothetical protein